MGSSNKGTIRENKVLGVVTRAEAERLMVDLANLATTTEERVNWLYKRHNEVFAPISENSMKTPLHPYEAVRLRNHLRKAWDASDRRVREWHIFQLRRLFSEWASSFAEDASQRFLHDAAWYEDAPPLTTLEAVMFYFQTAIGDRAKHCGNPDCAAPYFIAAKRWQKYCSQKCAGPALKESKRAWWRENRGKRDL